MTLRTPCGLAMATALTLATGLAQAYEDDDPTEESEQSEDFGEEWVWIDAGAGYQWVDMVTFEGDDSLLTAGLVPTKTGGPAADFGAGVRLWLITLGPRLRFGMFDTDYRGRSDRFTLWSLDGELGLRLPLGRFEPHLALAAGYTGLGGADDIVDQLGDGLSIEGANVRAGLGLDVFVVPMISLGADVSGEALILNRESVPLDDLAEAQRVGTLDEAEARVLEADGTSVGTSVTFVGKLGLHF